MCVCHVKSFYCLLSAVVLIKVCGQTLHVLRCCLVLPLCVCVRVSVCSHVVVNVSVRIVMCCVFWLCIGSILLPVTADDDGSVEVSKHADDCLTAKQVRTDKPQLCIYGDRPYMLGHWRSPVVMCLCGVCLGLSLWSLFGCAKPFLVRGWCCQTARSCMC